MQANGYINEIFSSFQGEGGSVAGSCQGRRQIFLRFQGCNLAASGQHCIWCDQPDAQGIKGSSCRIEEKPGTGDFKTIKCPVSTSQVLEIMGSLATPDLHSISLTGGEPLLQSDFLLEILPELEPLVYLETNGTLPEKTAKISGYVDHACVDIKDRSAFQENQENWKSIVMKEFETIDKLRDAGSRVFAKLVVTEETIEGDVAWVSKNLAELEVGLALQPVTLPDNQIGIERHKLFKLTETAAQYLRPEDITHSFQTHKFYGIL